MNEGELDTPDEEQTTSLYIKNLSFSTTEETLQDLFNTVGKLRSVTIAKKKDPKDSGKMLSMGFGFVEFWDKESAVKALKKYQVKNFLKKDLLNGFSEFFSLKGSHD